MSLGPQHEEAALPPSETAALTRFLRRVLVVAGVAAVLAFLWITREAFLLAFGAVIVAVLLTAITKPVERYMHVRRRWALLIAVLAVSAVLIGVGLVVGSEVTSQVRDLLGRLPEAVTLLEERFSFDLSEATDSGGFGRIGQDLLGSVTRWGATALGAVSSLIVVLVGGVFLASEPELYRDGVAALFPESQRERVRDTLDTMGRALTLWLIGQLVAMALVGVLYGLGAWAIGLPAPLAIGLFGAITEFVPVIGPVVGAIPALLVAAGQGTEYVLWTLGLVLAVQQIESNVITPLLGKRLVTIPPALFLFSIVAFGLLFGTVGVIVASPLTVVAFVAANKLYVRETLGQPTDVPGEKSSE